MFASSIRRLRPGDERNVLKNARAALDLEPQCLSHGLLHGSFEGISLGTVDDDSFYFNDHIAGRETGLGRRRGRKHLVDLDRAQFGIEDSIGING